MTSPGVYMQVNNSEGLMDSAQQFYNFKTNLERERERNYRLETENRQLKVENKTLRDGKPSSCTIS